MYLRRAHRRLCCSGSGTTQPAAARCSSRQLLQPGGMLRRSFFSSSSAQCIMSSSPKVTCRRQQRIRFQQPYLQRTGQGRSQWCSGQKGIMASKLRYVPCEQKLPCSMMWDHRKAGSLLIREAKPDSWSHKVQQQSLCGAWGVCAAVKRSAFASTACVCSITRVLLKAAPRDRNDRPFAAKC